MAMQITDSVVVARLLNATLVVPHLDHRSYWKDNRFAFPPELEFSIIQIELILKLVFLLCL